MSIPSGMNSSTVRPKASTSRTVLEAMSATGAGVKSITVMMSGCRRAVVGRLHRPFVFEIGGVAHAADDGRGMLVAGEVARQTGIDSHFDPGVVRIEVFDELFAGFDAQQSCLGNIVADADDDLVEDSQGIVHECLMAPGKGIERSRKNGDGV